MNETRKPAKRTAAASEVDGFTAEERAAMKERAQEVKAARRTAKGAKVDEEAALLAKIAELAEPDRGMAERLHAIITSAAPQLTPRTYYGMPAWAWEGSVLCFFQPAQKFKTRYATFGFNDNARLDDGAMWPTAFALAELTREVEERIAAL